MSDYKKRPVVRVLDFETGHAPDERCNGVIEIGYQDIVAKDFDLAGSPINWRVGGDKFQKLVKIDRPIEPDFGGVHQIEDEDLQIAPTWNQVLPYIGHVSNPHREIIAFAAFGIDTEVSLLGESAQAYPWICLHKIALRLWPQSPSHSNQTIRHFLKMKGVFSREDLLPAHRALPDARVTAMHLLAALNGLDGFNEPNSLEQLIEWTKQPSLLPRCKIGEWRGADKRGTPWPQVDAGFLHWILSKDFDSDTVFTVRHELARREADQREERELAELNSQLRANGMAESETFGTDKPTQNPFTDGQAGLPI